MIKMAEKLEISKIGEDPKELTLGDLEEMISMLNWHARELREDCPTMRGHKESVLRLLHLLESMHPVRNVKN